jgi:hypothetical protein
VIDYLPSNTYKLKNYEAASSFLTLKDLVIHYKDGIGFFVNSKKREEWLELLNNELIDSVYIEFNGVKCLLYSILSKEHYASFSKRITDIGGQIMKPLFVNRLFITENCFTQHLVPDYLKFMSETEFFIYQNSKDVIENFVRTKLDLPLKGEGWINELILYNRIKSLNGSNNTFHQVRFDWLGRQSIDIYLTNKKLAVEFQGLQHIKSVDFFGGQEGLIQNQRRDKKKRELLFEQGISLLYVLPNYDFLEVEKIINEHESKSLKFYQIGNYD